MPTHHRALGSARRRALALLVVPLAIAATVVAAGPASADSKTFADGVGEGRTSPRTDITPYQVEPTGPSLTVTVTTTATAAAPMPGSEDVEAAVDTNGDDAAEFDVINDGAGGRWTVLDAVHRRCSGVPVLLAGVPVALLHAGRR